MNEKNNNASNDLSKQDDGASLREQFERQDIRQIGVGPHEKPWPTDEHYDVELLENGDKRNVPDKYRYWSVDAIVAELDPLRFSYHVAIENWEHDLNVGTLVRNANAFMAKEVHIIGRKRWNRRGAMATYRYLHVRHHKTTDEFINWCKENAFPIIAVDILDDSKSVSEVDLPDNAMFVLGQEGPGISKEITDAADMSVHIPMFGSTRSINASVASGIIMYEWMRQKGKTV